MHVNNTISVACSDLKEMCTISFNNMKKVLKQLTSSTISSIAHQCNTTAIHTLFCIIIPTKYRYEHNGIR